jgi:transcriptional regulator
MYNIPYYKAKDHQEVVDFMHANPFVTICGVDNEGFPVVTQVPVLLKIENDKIIISGHVMRKQDHTIAFEFNNNVLVIFSAPSAFVSASWYSVKEVASTWNYQSVHAVGKIEMKGEEHLYKLLSELTAHFEKDPNSPTQVKNLDPLYMKENMVAIISFEIEVTELKHVFKLSQNRDDVSHEHIKKELSNGTPACKHVAAAMKR